MKEIFPGKSQFWVYVQSFCDP